MRQTVITASHACRIVWPTQAKKPEGLILTTAAVMIAERRIAVPVARGWNAQTAA